MKPINRYNLFTALFPFAIILASLSVLTYVSGDMSAAFTWSSINPIEAVQGIMFMLSFGFGLGTIAAIATLLGITCLVWVLLTFVVRAMIK